MRKFLFAFGIVGVAILFGVLFYKSNNQNPKKFFEEVNQNLESYEISGVLELVDDESLKKIKIQSLYKKKENTDYYYVRLEDEQTHQIQTIVKNDEGVFVYAQGFNRAFKFNSKWPNNGFKPYILENLISIFEEDFELEKIRDGVIVTSLIEDPLHPQAKYTQMLINQNMVIQQVNLLDEQENEITQFKITTYILNPEIDDNIFKLNSLEDVPTSVNDYSPVYPTNVYDTELVDQLKVQDGYIFRYKGDKYFTLVQKMIEVSEKLNIESYDEEFYISEKGLIFLDDNQAVLVQDNYKTTIYSNNLTDDEKINILLSLENNIVIEE